MLIHPLFNYYISYSSVSFSATKKSISLSLSNLLGASQSQVDVAAGSRTYDAQLLRKGLV